MSGTKGAGNKKQMTAVYVFFGFLTLLFAVNVVITIPLERPMDLAEEGSANLQRQRGKWYTLKEGTYSVGPSFGSIHIRSSFLLFHSNEYTYYCVTVNPGSEDAFSMPVRVKSNKQRSMENGEAVTLYGMASELTSDLRSQLEKAVPEHQGPLCGLCLNDNGDTVTKRWLSTAAFAALAGFCIFLIVKLARK